ncbi:MAG: hypothetical protein WA973_06275 [Mesorhizobium sp.]
MTPEHKALVERAIVIITDERECLFEGHQVGGVVKIDDEADQVAVDAMADMDQWLVDARAALSAQSAQPQAGVEATFRAGFSAGEATGKFGDDTESDAWSRYSASLVSPHAAGYQIIHRDENHGPTLERAAEMADVVKELHKGSEGSHPAFATASIIATSIRAMEVKHHD